MKDVTFGTVVSSIRPNCDHTPQHAIQVNGSAVTKRDTPELMRIEAEKTRQAHAIGSQCGLFRVPRVLAYDDEKGELVLERIPGLIHLSCLNKRTPVYKAVMDKLGRVLAIIHKDLTLPNSMLQSLSAVFSWPGTEVFIHGDFDTQNVCIERETSTIVILDWQTAPWYNETATFGSRYFDVVWFIEALLWQETGYLFDDPVTPLIDRFLDSYISESGGRCDLQKLSTYAHALFDEKGVMGRRYRGKGRYLDLRRYMLAKRFIKRIERMS